MTSLQRVVSIILFAIGGMLGMLFLVSLFTTPPADVSLQIQQTMQLIFSVLGLVGMALIALGVFLRTRRMIGSSVALLWGLYLLFWIVLVGLTLFSWDAVSSAVAQSRRPGKTVTGLIFFLGFLMAPVLELFTRRQAKRNSSSSGQATS